MPPTKERTTRLPTSKQHDSWWGNEHAVSQRFRIETEAMRKLFSPGKPLRVTYNDIVFDSMANKYRSGHNHFFVDVKNLRLRQTTDTHKPFCWDINFTIFGPGLNRTQIYPLEMKIYYSSEYPSDEPHIAIIDTRTDTSLRGGWHQFTAEGREYSRVCQTDHTDSHLTGHDPARTTASQHALRALRWLRVKHFGDSQE